MFCIHNVVVVVVVALFGVVVMFFSFVLVPVKVLMHFGGVLCL